MVKTILIFLIALIFGNEIKAQLQSDSTIVYAFLSTECPMCIAYTPVLNQIAADYKNTPVKVVGVFPNFYTTDALVTEYKKEHPIDFEIIIDSHLDLTNKFGATITPEVFVVKNDQVLYKGLIDNAYFRPGKRRGKTSEYYLRAALSAITSNKKPLLPFTNTIGCAIVKN
jgi:thiol-disulfide isomerase/thioredoxin